jgi:coproporphyrinogen III oxidase
MSGTVTIAKDTQSRAEQQRGGNVETILSSMPPLASWS